MSTKKRNSPPAAAGNSNKRPKLVPGPKTPAHKAGAPVAAAAAGASSPRKYAPQTHGVYDLNNLGGKHWDKNQGKYVKKPGAPQYTVFNTATGKYETLDHYVMAAILGKPPGNKKECKNTKTELVGPAKIQMQLGPKFFLKGLYFRIKNIYKSDGTVLKVQVVPVKAKDDTWVTDKATLERMISALSMGYEHAYNVWKETLGDNFAQTKETRGLPSSWQALLAKFNEAKERIGDSDGPGFSKDMSFKEFLLHPANRIPKTKEDDEGRFYVDKLYQPLVNGNGDPIPYNGPDGPHPPGVDYQGGSRVAKTRWVWPDEENGQEGCVYILLDPKHMWDGTTDRTTGKKKFFIDYDQPGRILAVGGRAKELLGGTREGPPMPLAQITFDALTSEQKAAHNPDTNQNCLRQGSIVELKALMLDPFSACIGKPPSAKFKTYGNNQLLVIVQGDGRNTDSRPFKEQQDDQASSSSGGSAATFSEYNAY